jgi:hypothetical protein
MGERGCDGGHAGRATLHKKTSPPPLAETPMGEGAKKIRNWMRERNKILGICNLCRLSTVFGGEPKMLIHCM